MPTNSKNVSMKVLFKGLSMAVILMACNDINAEQYRLTAGCNMPRGGDQVTMEVMSNPQAVRIGGNVLWDFSRLRLAERDMPLRHVSRGDSVLVRVEGRENSTLQLSGKGWQLASSRDLDRYLNYPLPERLMALPMAYGDTASGFFYGEGMADGVRFLRQQGETRVEALASGRLITPDGDSLRHALLVRRLRLGTTELSGDFDRSLKVSGDSTLLSRDSLTARYPILESTRIVSFCHGEPSDSLTVT